MLRLETTQDGHCRYSSYHILYAAVQASDDHAKRCSSRLPIDSGPLARTALHIWTTITKEDRRRLGGPGLSLRFKVGLFKLKSLAKGRPFIKLKSGPEQRGETQRPLALSMSPHRRSFLNARLGAMVLPQIPYQLC